MSGVATTIRLVDQMTAPIMSINNAINNMINQFNDVQSASDIDTASLQQMQRNVDMANFAAEQLNQTFQIVEDSINDASQGQSDFNSNIRHGQSMADGLVKKIGAAVAAYASFQGIKMALGLSDEMTNTIARLNMMNDGLQTTQELQEKIFLSAERSRGSYVQTANAVATLGTQAKKAFSSNDELIAFAEQLNKTFVIAGTSASGVESTMYNLTQALASGVLRGQDLNAVMSNAQPILENVANYMGVGVEKIREMAADGQLSADVIKNAMLAAADETNAKFESMPKTFSQVANSIKNQALVQFQPILNKLNEIANSAAFQSLVDGVISAFVVVSGVVLGIFDMISAVAQFASENWGILAPIIYTAVAALTAYYIALGIYNGVQAISNLVTGISNTLKSVAAIREAAHAAALAGTTAATFAQTAAQYGLNAALLACPLTWILIAIIAIIGAIYLVIGIINKCAGTSVSATGIIFGAFATLGAFLWNLFLGLLELVLGVINALINPFINIANFIGNVFTNPISSIIYLFQGMADTVLAILQKIASALDFVFGSSMADTVAGWRSGLKSAADDLVAEYAPNENYQNVMDNLDLSVEGLGLKRWAYGDAFNTGYAAGEAVDNAIANFDPASLFNTNIPDAGAYGSGGSFDIPDYTGGISDGVGNIDANTKNALDYSEEELKLWRDIAERDAVNRYTLSEVTVDFGGVTNNVNSEMDLDGIIDYIAVGVEEAVFELSREVNA